MLSNFALGAFILLATVTLVLGVRRGLRPGSTLSAWVVVAAGLLGAAGLWWQLDRARSRRSAERVAGALDALCRQGAASERDRAIRDLACAPDVRTADLRGGIAPYRDVAVHVAARRDALVVVARGLPPAPPGTGYHVWLEDGSGAVLDGAPLDHELTLLTSRPRASDAVAVRVTVDAPAATVPSGQVVVRGALPAKRAARHEAPRP